MCTVTQGICGARAIEQPLTVTFEKLGDAPAVATATSSPIASSDARHPLPAATFKEPVSSNLQILPLAAFMDMDPLLKFIIRR